MYVRFSTIRIVACTERQMALRCRAVCEVDCLQQTERRTVRMLEPSFYLSGIKRLIILLCARSVCLTPCGLPPRCMYRRPIDSRQIAIARVYILDLNIARIRFDGKSLYNARLQYWRRWSSIILCIWQRQFSRVSQPCSTYVMTKSILNSFRFSSYESTMTFGQRVASENIIVKIVLVEYESASKYYIYAQFYPDGTMIFRSCPYTGLGTNEFVSWLLAYVSIAL